MCIRDSYKAFPASAGVVERRYCTQSGLLAGAGCPSTAVGYYRADDLPDTCTYCLLYTSL